MAHHPPAPRKRAKRAQSPNQLANLAPQWKPGESGNLNGRPLGSRNRKTVIMAAIRRIAEKKNLTPEEIEDAIQASGIEKAMKGSFLHYAEVSNGLYGKISDKVDVTSGGKTIADLITLAHGQPKAGADAPAAVQG